MTIQQPIIGILLAAGSGTRFGGGKLMHPLEDGIAIAVHAARNLRAADLSVDAVLRPGDFPLADLLEQEGCHVKFCAQSVQGMGHTLAYGVSGARDASGWIVALADMPQVRPSTIRKIADALAGGALIAAPLYRGERGHPVGFSAALRAQLSALSGDSGARSILQQHRDAIVQIECDDPGIVLDIDEKADLNRVR